MWRSLQSGGYEMLSARKAEAFLILEAELATERSDVQTHNVEQQASAYYNQRRAFNGERR